MTTPDPRVPAPPAPARNSGTVFLICGLVFLAVGAGTRQVAFLAMGPAFLAIGIAFLARARKAGRDPRN